MKLFNIKLGIIACLSLLMVACASTDPNPAEKFKNIPEAKLYQDALIDMSESSYKSAIEKFEALDARYPFGQYAENEQLYIIYAYYKSDEIAEALASTDRFIHLHPDSKNIDYAYFMKGVLNYRQNQGVFEKYFPSDLSERDLAPARQSYITFATLVESYPNSKYRDAAIEYMIYLRNLMAEQEVKIAQFYYDREAYIAASNRANIVIMHYEGAPVMKQALQIAVNSYKQLHLDGLALMYQNVIDLNYSDKAKP